MSEQKENRQVIGFSTRKNIMEVIYLNVLPDGTKQSITRFEPINRDRPCYRRQFSKGANDR